MVPHNAPTTKKFGQQTFSTPGNPKLPLWVSGKFMYRSSENYPWGVDLRSRCPHWHSQECIPWKTYRGGVKETIALVGCSGEESKNVRG